MRLALVACVALATACASNRPLPPPPRAPAPVAAPPAPAGPEAWKETPDAPFREHAPEPGAPIVFHPPRIESFALKNGIRVLFVERHEIPVVSVRVVARTGAGDVAARPGVLAFMGAMLEQGTEKRTALAVSDEYEAIGATHGAWADWDGAHAAVKVLTAQIDPALDLLSDVVLHAAFPQPEIERLRARSLASLQSEKTSPGAMASNAVAATLYGRTHPYGHSLSGREDDVKAIARADLVRAYGRVLAPSNVTLVVAGDVKREALASKLEAAFGAWKAAPVARGTRPGTPKGADARVVLVDRPGAPQSQVVLAEPGVPFPSPDRDALAVMNAILGGMFSSRINLNLREAHAYTYGARSHFIQRHGPGPFTAGGAIVRDKTVPAIEELLHEINAMRDGDVTAEELADAKEAIKLAMPGRFETVSDVTGALADLAVYDLPIDEYASRPARIEAVTAADVKRVAQAHLHPGRMKVVVVGDRASLEPQLGALKLGPPDVRDPWGDRATDHAEAKPAR
jgi:predicted Zn-dependent peptidase